MEVNAGLPVYTTFVKSDPERREKRITVPDCGIAAQSPQKNIPDIGVYNLINGYAVAKEVLDWKAEKETNLLSAIPPTLPVLRAWTTWVEGRPAIPEKNISTQALNSLEAPIHNYVIHVSPLLGRFMAIIMSNQIVIASRGAAIPDVETVKIIPMKSICNLVVDEDMHIIDLVLKPEGMIPLSATRIIPAETQETEIFINHLLIASSRLKHTNSKKWKYRWADFLDVTTSSSFLNLPSSFHLKQYFKKLDYTDANFSFRGLALASSHDGTIKYTEELMFQQGTEQFFPVKAELMRNSVQLFKTDEHGSADPHISLPLKEISRIRRTEHPRPHSCCIQWESETVYLAASTESAANEWFDRLCHAKRKRNVSEFQAAHIIIAETTLFIFSCETSIKLLETPILNITVNTAPCNLGQDLDKSIVIEPMSLEAEENVSHENERWTLKFVRNSNANSFYNCITSNPI